jgi:hypothetical protein
MTIDKVICKNFKVNFIIDYAIFINNILPYINNIYLNQKEKKKYLCNKLKKLIIFNIEKLGNDDNIFVQNYLELDGPISINFSIMHYDMRKKLNSIQNDNQYSIIISFEDISDEELITYDAINKNIMYITNYIITFSLSINSTFLECDSDKIYRLYLKYLNKLCEFNNNKFLSKNGINMEIVDGMIYIDLRINYKFDKDDILWENMQKIFDFDKYTTNRLANFKNNNIIKNNIKFIKKNFIDYILNYLRVFEI